MWLENNNNCTSGHSKCFKENAGCSIYGDGDDRDCRNLSSIQTGTELAPVSSAVESAAAGGAGSDTGAAKGAGCGDAAGGGPDGGAGWY